MQKLNHNLCCHHLLQVRMLLSVKIKKIFFENLKTVDSREKISENQFVSSEINPVKELKKKIKFKNIQINLPTISAGLKIKKIFFKVWCWIWSQEKS